MSVALAMLFTLLAAPAPDGGAAPAEIRRIPSAFVRAMAYPSLALGQDIPGEAVLRCRVNSAAMPARCSIYSETPGGFGFGKAAMAMRSSYRLERPAAGQDPWVLLPVTFDPAKRLNGDLANESLR